LRPVRIWVALAIALPVVISLLVPLPAVDLAYQVRAGAEILATGSLPTADTWTFTIAGAPWTDQQWLAQVLLAAVHALGGWELLVVLRAVLVGGVAALLLAAARLRGAGDRTAAVLSLLAFMLASPALALRPQLFGIMAFAALLLLVALRERQPRALLAAPLVIAMWANLHGSFVLAPVLLGWVWLDDLARGRPWRASFAVLIAGCLATLATPFGVGVWAYAVGIGTSPVIAQTVSEWQRTTPFTVPGLLFYLSLAAAAAVVWRGRSRLAWPDALWLASMALLAVWAVRGLAWWPAGAVPVVALALARPRATDPLRRSVATSQPGSLRAGPQRLLVAVLAVALTAAMPWWRSPDALTGRRGILTYAPSGLAAALRTTAKPGARVFVPQPWGSWFEWAVPDARYLVDARFELFPAEVWDAYAAISSGGPDAAAALDAWRIDVVVLPSGWPELGQAWRTAFADADGAVLVRAATP
jgi:hypothetical protein